MRLRLAEVGACLQAIRCWRPIACKQAPTKLIAGALVGWMAMASGRAADAPPPSVQEYTRFALQRIGDAEKGRVLFHENEKIVCARCHTVDGSAAKAGPDLFAIGDKFGRREIINAIIRPSETIAVGYSTTTIETKGGEAFTGIVKQATDGAVTLMGADGKAVRIGAGDIARQQTVDTSLMPEGLQASLTRQEFADLVEYLVSLKQPASATMVAHGMPDEIAELATPVELRPFVSEELKFELPVWFGPVPGEAQVFMVAENESGRIWRLEKSATGADRKTIFAETGREQRGTRGFLGMALHPKFQENGRYFIVRHQVEDGRFATFIYEREASADRRRDSGKEPRVILKIDALTNVHYGGGLEFGPDGFFYVGMGDSGPQEDPNGNGQNTRLLLGKVLRIDVDHREAGQPYSVPRDNPFVDRANFRPEIWAYGFREPWRFSFDPANGDLWVGDVGQDRYEEVDLVRRGENYGWNVFEGFERFSNRYRRDGETFVPPVFAYGRKFGPSVTGGYVYRANPRSSFAGIYVFGDYESKRIFGLTQENRRLKTVRQLAVAPQRVVSFGRDERGELYVVGYEGMIYRLVFDGAKFE